MRIGIIHKLPRHCLAFADRQYRTDPYLPKSLRSLTRESTNREHLGIATTDAIAQTKPTVRAPAAEERARTGVIAAVNKRDHKNGMTLASSNVSPTD